MSNTLNQLPFSRIFINFAICMNPIVRHIAAAGMTLLAGVSFTAYADLLQEGRQAFLDYDFERASELYEKYAAQLRKKADPEGEEALENLERRLEIAENALENVQKIEVIDRIDVPSADFFKSIRFPQSGGYLLSSDNAPFKKGREVSDFVFSNEFGDFMMWTVKDTDGSTRIVESTRLTDGSWDEPILESDALNEGGDVKNPFMLADGTTLYFAGDGEGSMGGYDIFVASKDPSTGEYRQPLNLGFPFNSPYDEYLLAIDEENGIGWLATDRNQLEGKISIYVYKVPEVRTNYDTEDEDIDIVSLARIGDITETQNPDTDYSSIRQTIASLSKETKGTERPDFLFPMPGGKVYMTLSDFHSSGAKRLMSQYLDAVKEQDSDLGRLSEYRRKYNSSDRKGGAATGFANQIRDLEKKTESQRTQLQAMRNSIITAEMKK